MSGALNKGNEPIGAPPLLPKLPKDVVPLPNAKGLVGGGAVCDGVGKVMLPDLPNVSEGIPEEER